MTNKWYCFWAEYLGAIILGITFFIITEERLYLYLVLPSFGILAIGKMVYHIHQVVNDIREGYKQCKL